MFKGIQKVSLIDYPGEICATLFTGGCNFRCNWCHNWDLVLPEKVMLIPDISEDEIKDFLITRKGKLGGVCITGGEPCMWKSNLAEFMRWCKAEGFKVKLDTNGSFPDVLNEYLSKGLVDYIAMDIKNSFSKYAKTVGLDSVNLDKIKLSVEIIKKSRIPHTFRTTVVPSLIEAYDLSQIEEFLGEKLILQDYRPVSNYSEVNYG